MIKAIVLLILFSVTAKADYRPYVISTNSIQAISHNFNQASIQINTKLSKYGNDTVYGLPKFNQGIKFSDGTTQTSAGVTPAVILAATQTFTGSNTFSNPVTFSSSTIFNNTLFSSSMTVTSSGLGKTNLAVAHPAAKAVESSTLTFTCQGTKILATVVGYYSGVSLGAIPSLGVMIDGATPINGWRCDGDCDGNLPGSFTQLLSITPGQHTYAIAGNVNVGNFYFPDFANTGGFSVTCFP